ncbi:hypothetical protein LUZ60_008548 [Juncus effusus]|nr:hypothetical protein LUZ60_008548 [Juncus effusus]
MAIKVFNLESHVALTSFKSECEVMRNLRHRNIIKTITTCSSIDYNGNYFKAIVFEYMPNGSLDDWLHPKEDNKTLNFEQRLNIAIDVASALDYLHNHCEKQIVHCDLKPKNILLDYEMVACVGDFGLARFITKRDEISRNSELSAGFKGTIGYAPPEYGRGNEISVHGDIYSYGILIVEMVTGKRPTDDIFGESLSLREYVKIELRNNIMNIIDPSLIVEIGNDEGFEDKSMRRIKLECINVMLEIGLLCSEESPRKRMRIKDVADQLNEVKELLLNQSVDF